MNYININKTLVKSAAFISLLVSLAASSAVAVPHFTFDDDIVSGGTLSYGGGNGSLQGRDIIFDVVSDINGTNFSIEAAMNFDTGSYLGDSSGAWRFDSGGWIEMTGTVYDSSGDAVVQDETIFSGSFGEESLFSGVSGLFSIFQAVGADTVVNEDVLDLLGFDQQVFSLSAALNSLMPDPVELGGNGSGTINVTVSDSDLTLYATGTPVPSTGSTVTMLGIGLTIIGLVARRNK